jgi:hypothetical protein
MKTADELIDELCIPPGNVSTVFLRSEIKKVATAYARQALEEAARRATIKTIRNIESGNLLSSVDKQSILQIKEELK